MGDPEAGDTYGGSVPVRVSASDVHKAVRNILTNEMKLDPDEVRKEAFAAAEARVAEQVDAYLRKTGYSSADLAARVQRFFDYHLQRDVLEKLVKEIVSNKTDYLVRQLVDERLSQILAVYIKDGFRIKVGWGSSPVPVKFVQADEAPETKANG